MSYLDMEASLLTEKHVIATCPVDLFQNSSCKQLLMILCLNFDSLSELMAPTEVY